MMYCFLQFPVAQISFFLILSANSAALKKMKSQALVFFTSTVTAAKCGILCVNRRKKYV